MTSRKRIALYAAVGATAALLAACQGAMTAKPLPPLELAPKVDIARFMGDWYVIANIPTFLEKGAHAAKENYRLEADGSIATTFSFRADAFDGAAKEYHSRGFVLGGDGAIWGQQYVWPIKADYRVSYVADDYSATIISREKRDYVWIMARTPRLAEAELQRLIERVGRQGYDTSKLQRVPQPPG
ncbi:MAG: lipocalin family protein [Burkholderiales bacterium]|nr:lipocalin family protein [Burkholderiales bacterium]